MESTDKAVEVYQLRIWIRQISPQIWRRLLVRSDSTIAELHAILQIAFDWSDEHLHRFLIRGNQIVSKRFVKKQQMRWTRRGAHLLLQIRTRVLDDTLTATFQRWYPGMKTGESQQEKQLQTQAA